MRRACICFLLRGGCVLLAPRRGDRWEGCFTGYGGGTRYAGEPVRCAVKREVFEESGVIVREADLDHRARVIVHKRGLATHQIDLFTSTAWYGLPRASGEMGVPEFFRYRDLPEKMIPGDDVWLPRLLSGSTFVATVCRDRLRTAVSFSQAHFSRRPAH